MKDNLGLVTASILINARAIDEFYSADGVFVEGRPGSSYSIVLRNNTSKRLECLVTVDGLSVIDGETPTDNTRGYILAPYGNTTIEGWRTSLDTVNLFKFGDPSRSQSAGTGHGAANCGVIGVLVYQEFQPKPVMRGMISKGMTKSADRFGPECSARGFDLGTGAGEEVSSRVSLTTFNRDPNKGVAQIVMYYASRTALVNRGIIPKPVVVAEQQRPQPFPGMTFCKTPKFDEPKAPEGNGPWNNYGMGDPAVVGVYRGVDQK